jgi:trehalose synthase
VLLGNFATDDPEGEEIFQTRAAVVLQKSLREGFGLTVAEAMWKGTPVIGGNVGCIRYQIEDGVNSFLVSSVEETAERMVALVNDKELRNEMGHKARETVRKNFLRTRYLEQYFDLFGAP